MAEMSVNYYYDKDEDTRKKIDELLRRFVTWTANSIMNA